MKVGNIVDGLAVVDVKRVNKMNLIQFTKAVSEYIELGYKLDVHSSRQVGLVLQMDVYKLESNLSGNVPSVGEGVGDSLKEDVVKEPNETTVEAPQESTEKLETAEDVVTGDTEVEYEQATAPEQNNAVVKKTRAKKTT